MTVLFDPNLLTAYYQAKTALSLRASGAGGAGAGAGTGSKAAGPTAPWSATSTAPRADDLVKSVLNGSKFINTGATKLDVANAKPDYRSLFALYQGLNALEGLSEHIVAKGVGDTEKARLRTVFDRGLKEVAAFIDSGPFKEFGVALGAVAAKVQSSVGVKRAPDGYQTQPLHQGSLGTEVAAFTGPVAFQMTLTRSGNSQVVSFDLNEMGSTPRTMSNVVLYLNGKLSQAGVLTRFANVRIPGQPITTKAGKETITLGTAPDSFALKVKADTAEAVSFQAPQSAPAVYVGGVSGLGNGAQLLAKYETGGGGLGASAVDGRISNQTLGAQVTALKSSVTAPDGSLYVLAEVQAGLDGEKLKGAKDAALIKYDSAGNMVFSRSLGAASDAQGFALTVSADGAQVAVGGQVTGVLDAGDLGGADPRLSDSFVSVFDAQGEALWSQRAGALGDDRVTALAFAADGSLYASGVSAGAILPGHASLGGATDSYLRGFSATGKITFTTAVGTAGVDRSSGLVVDGNALVMAGVEGGQAVLRRYDLQPAGGPVLASQRSLGSLGGGDIAGLALAADGSLIVGGTTRAALSAGAANNSYDGTGGAGFVARLSADLSGAGDRLTYFDGATDQGISAFAVSGGQVYVAGQVKTTPLPGQTVAHDGFAAAVDPLTGQVNWSTTLKGADRESRPTMIAVDPAGASVLDRLGLPTGILDLTPSDTVVGNSAARAGDQFSIRSGGFAQTVTIEATDTLKTLALKISRASGFSLKAQVVKVDGRDQLSLTPANPRAEIEIEAGKTGKDALEALGIAEGLVTNDPTTASAALKAKAKASYGLNLSTTLNLSDAASAKQATGALLAATSIIRQIYNDMVKPPTLASDKPSGPVPAYLTNQIANYQLALARLTGSG